MEALRPKLVKRLESMMATVEHVTGNASGPLSHPSAGRIADAVLSVTRADDEHRELLEALLSCRSAVVLSGYAAPLYDDALGGWHRHEIAAQTGNGGAARARTEVLWSNRPFAQGSLFDCEATA